MKKKFLIVLVLVLVIAIAGYNYVYKSHRDISKETAAYSVSAIELVHQFQENANQFQDKYLNQTIDIKGKITLIDGLTVTLNQTIFCTMNTDFNSRSYTTGSEVTVKGRFIGYDDLLEEIKLDQCSIAN